ncbi:hypothetical protein C8J55DRAFT_563806 [Lentinula edodes]|uniref:Uncharacterized protein n=1 Tax=Lentinula lateritia TaxID=40482 RepID=A0A9W8ZZP7_9AGAR|nr:hypothetical protein C8J55DRAFT_563806 [Lentinula edodes]
MTSQTFSFAGFQDFFPNYPHIYNTANITGIRWPPLVVSHRIHVPGEFHYTGHFAPFDSEHNAAQILENERSRPFKVEKSMLGHSLIDKHDFENPRPAPHPITIPLRDVEEPIGKDTSGSMTSIVRSTNDAVQAYPISSSCGAFSPELDAKRERQGSDSGETLNIHEEYTFPLPAQSRDDFPPRIVQSSALKTMPPTFTNPFDGNKKIEFRETCPGEVIYSTERAWTQRNYFGSDDDEVYIPLERGMRSKFST